MIDRFLWWAAFGAAIHFMLTSAYIYAQTNSMMAAVASLLNAMAAGIAQFHARNANAE